MKNLFQLFKRYGLIRFLAFATSEFYSRLWKYRVLHSFSQSGEDTTLDKLLGYKKRGFYVDIGAYDPYRFSNTMRFYQRGWRGINIEPDPERFKSFVSLRSRDTNLNVGIASKEGALEYFAMDPPTLSTFSQSQARSYVKDGFILRKKQKIRVKTLKNVLGQYAKKKKIDFLSLDVEGFEMEVLKSHDWKKFRPKFLCIETAVDDNKGKKTSKIKNTVGLFLKSKGYMLHHDNGLNSFYKDTLHG